MKGTSKSSVVKINHRTENKELTPPTPDVARGHRATIGHFRVILYLLFKASLSV